MNPRFPDVESLLMDLLVEAGVHAYLHEPEQWKTQLPAAHVGAIPAPESLNERAGQTFAHASVVEHTLVQIDVYDVGRDKARESALRCLDVITGRPVRTPGGLIDEVRKVAGPIPGEPPDDSLSLFTIRVRAEARAI